MRFAADGESGIGGNGWGVPSSDRLVSENPGEVNGGMLIRRLGVVGSAIVLGFLRRQCGGNATALCSLGVCCRWR